jgi:hypothetical protein
MKTKTLILKFFILVGVLFLLDFLIGKTLNHYYFTQKYGEYYILTKTIENPSRLQADIMVFGSSRAKRHYNPTVISGVLGGVCYNAGYDAQSILYHKAIFDIVVEKYNPKIIILEVSSTDLNLAEGSCDPLSILLPYVQFYPELWNTLRLKSPFERIKYLSKIYPYNSLLDKIVKGNKIPQEVDVNGFIPFYYPTDKPANEETYPETNLDPDKIKAFNAFITACKEKKINLFVVYSPEYVKAMNTPSSIIYIKKKCKESDIEYISYQNSETFLKGELFRESLHLNNIGAEKFSLDIALKIKEKMQTNGK